MKLTKKIGAVVFAIDPAGELRVLLRKNSPFNGSPEEWNVIYGHIEHGERLEDCAMREIVEEVGIKPSEVFSGNYEISKTFADIEQIDIAYYWAIIDQMMLPIILNEESIGYQWATLLDSQESIQDPLQSSAIERCFKACIKAGKYEC